MQCFIDEVAIAAGKDPLQYRIDPALELACSSCGSSGRSAAPVVGVRGRWWRRRIQRSARDWRAAKLFATCPIGLRLVAKLPKGTGMGVAFQFAHAGYVAYVVEVAVDANKKIKINKAWCAVDIGRQIVNPSMAKNLVEGGFVEGMSHVMGWEITIDKGRVVQGNFPPIPADSYASSSDIGRSEVRPER